eukprot:4240759-Amphidinium_carterae.2
MAPKVVEIKNHLDDFKYMTHYTRRYTVYAEQQHEIKRRAKIDEHLCSNSLRTEQLPRGSANISQMQVARRTCGRSANFRSILELGVA